MTPAVRFLGVTTDSQWSPQPPPLELEVPAGALCVIESIPALSAPLIRACIGLASLATGRIEVLGSDPAMLDRGAAQRLRRQLGVGLRPGGLTSNQTLRMNVATPLLYSGLAGQREAVHRADEVLEQCGLSRWADHRPDDTPPDVRQGAVIARAVARRPDLMLLEDPFSAVAPTQVERLLSLCRGTAHTILIVTQRLDETLRSFSDLTTCWTPQQPERYEMGAN